MSENVPKFQWTKSKVEAAILLATEDLTEKELSSKVGCSTRQLFRWKKHPIFAAHVAKLVKEYELEVFSRGIAQKVRRVHALSDRWRRLKRVIDQRAAQPEMANIAGGDTGLIVRRLKMIGSGESATVVEEHEVDTGLLRELREHEKQAAQELGQWIDKVAPTSPDGNDEYQGGGFSESERKSLIEILFARLGIGVDAPHRNGQANHA